MSITERIEELIVPHLTDIGLEVVDIQYRREQPGWVLRVFIDKPGGIVLSDCEATSRKLKPLIDLAGLITNNYELEISSPGIRRTLKKEADFRKFIGQRAAVKIFAPINGRRNFTGFIASVENSQVMLKLENNEEVGLVMANIARANLDPEIKI